MPTLYDELAAATAGLEFMSETDAPIEPIVWDETAPTGSAELLSRLGLPHETEIELLDLDTFFRPATTLRDWFDPDETEHAQRFTALAQLLKQRLHNPRVYKIGAINRQVYVLGQTDDGKLAGIKTHVVET